MVVSSFEDFTQQSYADSYDFVVVALNQEDMTGDDVGINEEVLNYYAKAPVFCVSFPDSDSKAEVITALQALNSKTLTAVFTFDDKPSRAESLAKLVTQGIAEHEKIYLGELKSFFGKYDVDNNGVIDKDEIGALLEALGITVEEKDLEAGILEMDIDGNGKISYDEFARWFFTGMKPYNRSTKLLKNVVSAGGNLANLLSKDGVALLKGDTKLLDHVAQYAFNPFETAGLSLNI